MMAAVRKKMSAESAVVKACLVEFVTATATCSMNAEFAAVQEFLKEHAIAMGTTQKRVMIAMEFA
jgi:hypothetical protein